MVNFPVGAFDWGGTNLRFGIVDINGKILESFRRDTFVEGEPGGYVGLSDSEMKEFREEYTRDAFLKSLLDVIEILREKSFKIKI
jgi:predicted NBD/HSP70 family sugar kinase